MALPHHSGRPQSPPARSLVQKMGVRVWDSNRVCMIAALMLTAILADARAADSSGQDDTWLKILKKGQAASPTNTPERWEISSGSFIIPSDIPSEPILTCYFATPKIKSGRFPARRLNPLYFFHTPSPKNGNILDNGICNRLVTDYGMTVFGIAFKESSQAGLFYGNQSDRQKFYTFSKSGSFHAILTAWSIIRGQFEFSTRRFYLYGYSAGGIGVQRFAEEFPEYCAGVISVNGHTFTQKNKAACPTLIIHSFGDGGCSAGTGLWRYYSSMQTPCLRLLMSPSWERLKEGNDFAFHAVQGNVTELSCSFLEAINDIQRSSGNDVDAVPTIADWPYVALSEDPLIITANRGPGTIQDITARGFTPMPIPSARFYAEMLKNPLPPVNLHVPKGDVYLMRPRPDQAPKGVVTVVHQEADLAQAEAGGYADRLFVDGQYFAEKGYAAILATSREEAEQAFSAKKVPLVQNATRRCLMFVDPSLETIDVLGEVSNIIIGLTKPVDLPSYMAVFEKLLRNRTRLLVLLPYRTKVDYEAAVAGINPAIRGQIFPPFDPTGLNLGLSMRQQQLEAAVQFLDRTSEPRK